MCSGFYTISLESYKRSGSWQLRGMILGLVAILLDAVGILMTRYGFDNTPDISSAQVNGIRCIGAIIGFLIINYFYYPKKDRVHFKPEWGALTKNEKINLIIGSIGGTYCSLMLYLIAVSKGQLSVISSVTVTGPMFAEIFECVRDRKYPSLYVFVAFIFFIGGFIIFSQL